MPDRSNMRIVRNRIREDVLFFAIPALLVFTVGLMVSTFVGSGGLIIKLVQLVTQPEKPSPLSVHNIIGLALFVVGMTVAIVAVVTLRGSYSSTLMIREDHRLVTHGIYRYTRHPVYLGVITAMLGFPVYGLNLYGFLIMSALIPIFLYRIKMEERLLVEAFGDDYREYQERTSTLVPFFY